jgi:divalent metal cation (Fe/Co/Zn/Cd) transporter
MMATSAFMSAYAGRIVRPVPWLEEVRLSSAGARPVVVAGLCVSVALAAAKLLAVLESSTSALLASTVHSLIDASCLGLLFLGIWNEPAVTAGPQRRPPDRTQYFWSFVVAIPLYAMGGGIALHEGVERLARPQPLVAPSSDMLALAVAAAGWALVVLMAMREFRSAGGSTDPLQTAVDRPEAAPIIAVMVISAAAVAGNVLALGGLLGAANGGDPRSDAFAAVAVGMAMSAVAAFMAIEVKRLLTAGPAVLPSPEMGSALGSSTGASVTSQAPPETGNRLPAANASGVLPALETKSMPAGVVTPIATPEKAMEPAAAPGQGVSTAKPPVTPRQAERKGRGKRRR